MIDTHSHLLPGVDHGCPDLKTSIGMARAAAASGVEAVVCTPHLTDYDEAGIARVGEVIEEVRAELAKEGIELELKLGFEVDLSIAFEETKEKLQAVAIQGTGGAIVLEVPFNGWPPFLEETIFRLSTTGFLPVLAHPERNDRIQASSALLERLLAAGAVAQGTAGSLSGEFGRAAEKAFFKLLAEGHFSLLASDAHAYREEGWTMRRMMAAVEGKIPPDSLTTLVEGNPRLLLEGQRPWPIEPGAPPSSSWRERVRR